MKLWKYPERIAAWKRNEFFAPVGVEVDLTNRCNLGCSFCHFAYTHTRGPHARANAGYDLGDEMDLELLKHILPELAVAGVKSVTFSGGGEPTLYPHFIDAGYFAVRTGLKLGLYTNGTLVNGEKAAWLKEHAAWVVVSLDEPDWEHYKQVKGVNGFDAAERGIRNLVEAKGACVVGVSFLVRRDNWTRIPQMVDEFHKLGADYCEFRPTVTYDAAEPGKVAEDTAWVRDAVETLRDVEGPDVEIAWDKFNRYAHWERGYTTCPAVLFTGCITPNGRVWACVNRRGYPESEIGDLAQESFETVWKRNKEFAVDRNCRLLCRGDVLNRALLPLAEPMAHEEFV